MIELELIYAMYIPQFGMSTRLTGGHAAVRAAEMLVIAGADPMS